jgi:hypothetical protein
MVPAVGTMLAASRFVTVFIMVVGMMVTIVALVVPPLIGMFVVMVMLAAVSAVEDIFKVHGCGNSY